MANIQYKGRQHAGTHFHNRFCFSILSEMGNAYMYVNLETSEFDTATTEANLMAPY